MQRLIQFVSYVALTSVATSLNAQTPDVESCATQPIIASNVSVELNGIISVPTISIFFAVYGGNSGLPKINTLELIVGASDGVYNIEGVDLDFTIDDREYNVGLQMSYEQDDWMPALFSPSENASWGLAPTFVSILKDAHDVAFSINSKEGKIFISLSSQELSTVQSGLATCLD